MIKKLFLLLVLISVALLTACGSQGSEQPKESQPKVEFPTKEIKLVYHSKAGSGGDLFLRNMAKPLEKVLGVPIIVENRTGASGANAWSYVKNAKPDGYTLIGTSSTIVSAPVITPMEVSYKDFKPLAQMFVDPQLLYVSSKSEYENVQELINYEKTNPKKLVWARSTPSSGDTISLAMITQAADLDPNYVAFEGGSEVLVAILGGHVDVAVGEYSELRGQIESGQIRVLTTLTNQRHPQLQEVPTMKESGWDIVVRRPRAVMAPLDTPDEITQILIGALEKVYDDPEFQKVWEQDGLVAEFAPGDELMQIYDDLDIFLQDLLK